MSEFRNATERVEFDKDEGKSQLKYDHMLEVTDLKARIAELEAAQRWIPVSERLPEATEYVYAVVYDAIDNTSKVSMLKHYGDGNWFSWESERYVVTHWMPLPEPPKERER